MFAKGISFTKINYFINFVHDVSRPGMDIAKYRPTRLFCATFSASEGNFPSLNTLFSLFCTLAGGFSLTFAALIL